MIKNSENGRNCCIEICSGSGIENITALIEYLDSTDFFTAPASTQYHGAEEGGLIWHSLMVYKILLELCGEYKSRTGEEVAGKQEIIVAGLFHDLCKAGCYKRSTRNVKNDVTGKWEKAEFWKYEDEFPIGHGEKSVILLQQYIKLTPKVITAIRAHMGDYECNAFGYNASALLSSEPLAALLHIADFSESMLNK